MSSQQKPTIAKCSKTLELFVQKRINWQNCDKVDSTLQQKLKSIVFEKFSEFLSKDSLLYPIESLELRYEWIFEFYFRKNIFFKNKSCSKLWKNKSQEISDMAIGRYNFYTHPTGIELLILTQFPLVLSSHTKEHLDLWF